MRKITLFIILSVFIFSCTDKNKVTPEPENTETEIVNEFVFNISSTYYLWTDQISTEIDYKTYTDSYKLFEDIKNSSLDHWSFLHDNYEEVLNSFNGIQKTGGYKLKLFKYENSNDVYGIFEYIYKDGAAYNAGIKRGDCLLKIDEQTLNMDNYSTLLSKEQYTVTLGEFVDEQINETNTVSLSHSELSINPILEYKVIEESGIKIGYLLYNQFIEDYVTELENAISFLKTEGITELVLDLRYNPGGYVTTCKKLASMLAPASAIGNVFLTMQWNTELTEYLTENYGADSDKFIEKFPTPNVNLNLSRLFVLTSSRTASASEAIINGLAPYMNVQVIGEQTSGKYTAASLFYDEEYKHNWSLYLVISKIANANGITDYINGFIPNIEAQDDYQTPLGDKNEVLLEKAISYLTGVTKKSKKHRLFNKPYKSYFNNKFEKQGLLIY